MRKIDKYICCHFACSIAYTFAKWQIMRFGWPRMYVISAILCAIMQKNKRRFLSRSSGEMEIFQVRHIPFGTLRHFETASINLHPIGHQWAYSSVLLLHPWTTTIWHLLWQWIWSGYPIFSESHPCPTAPMHLTSDVYFYFMSQSGGGGSSPAKQPTHSSQNPKIPPPSPQGEGNKLRNAFLRIWSAEKMLNRIRQENLFKIIGGK